MTTSAGIMDHEEVRRKNVVVIKRFIQRSNKTVFVVEHDFAMVEHLADKVIVLEGTLSVNCVAHAPQPWNLFLATAFVVEHDFAMVEHLADKVIVLEGTLVRAKWYGIELRTIQVGREVTDLKLHVIKDKKKNIFKLEKGEDIALYEIENVYAKCKFVAECFGYGRLNKLLLILECSQIRTLEASSYKRSRLSRNMTVNHAYDGVLSAAICGVAGKSSTGIHRCLDVARAVVVAAPDNISGTWGYKHRNMSVLQQLLAFFDLDDKIRFCGLVKIMEIVPPRYYLNKWF
ncbi:ABC transporter ABCE, P-loop containing nucleoside triphosphate hydrolase [Artemisia annua]|uniref:ABC transporter ABCE, P-loop containing nucleoside triphosphate hydrolase n=1 Tax=Artemisia annua TaxID=35608 RepID=A0A2U1M813_ARTAN|nr:ABC transporter ABCE, P-loop containing nucleoside triphosphate hydrolase [Artemisia annua]